MEMNLNTMAPFIYLSLYIVGMFFYSLILSELLTSWGICIENRKIKFRNIRFVSALAIFFLSISIFFRLRQLDFFAFYLFNYIYKSLILGGIWSLVFLQISKSIDLKFKKINIYQLVRSFSLIAFILFCAFYRY